MVRAPISLDSSIPICRSNSFLLRDSAISLTLSLSQLLRYLLPEVIMTSNPKCILIIGGGVAGPVLALFLKQAGFCAHIFEASAGPSETGGGLGLAPNGMNVLAAAGVIDQGRNASV